MKALSQLASWRFNQHTIHFQSYSKPANAHKNPVVFLASLFESYTDCDKEFTKLAMDYPIVVVHLPGFGVSSETGKDLSGLDYAQMLSGLLNYLGIDSCELITSNYATNVALAFTEHYENRVDKLIVVAPIFKARDSAQYLIKESLKLLNEGNIKAFAAQMSLYHIATFSRPNNYQVKNVLIEHYRSMLSCDPLLLEKYKVHSNRLLAESSDPNGVNGLHQANVCIVAGAYDMLSTPAEAFEFRTLCTRSTFLLMDQADQMMGQQKNDVLFRLYKRFLDGKSVKRMKDAKYIGANELAPKYIRVSDRVDVQEDIYLENEQGYRVKVKLEKITAFGCQILGEDILAEGPVKLVFPFGNLTLDAGLFAMDKGALRYRGIFSHQSFDAHEKLQGYIHQFSQEEHKKLVA